MKMRIGQYAEHWRDMLFSWECWLDHLAVIAALIVLAIVVDTFIVWWKSRGAELSLWEKIQVASLLFVPTWWIYVFTQLYIVGE